MKLILAATVTLGLSAGLAQAQSRVIGQLECLEPESGPFVAGTTTQLFCQLYAPTEEVTELDYNSAVGNVALPAGTEGPAVIDFEVLTDLAIAPTSDSFVDSYAKQDPAATPSPLGADVLIASGNPNLGLRPVPPTAAGATDVASAVEGMSLTIVEFYSTAN